MPTICLNVGAHLTGSPRLQQSLGKSPDFLATQDCALIRHKDVASDVIPDVVAWRRDPDLVARPDSLTRLLKGLERRPERSVVWTYEGLLGELNVAMDGSIYPHAPRVIEALGEILDGSPTKIAFTVRSYPDFIESAYTWLVRNSQAFTFERFLGKIDLDLLTWRPAVEALRGTFGDENVLVTAYEVDRGDARIRDHLVLRHFFGSDVDLSTLTRLGPAEDPPLNRKGLEFIRLVHGALRRSDVFSPSDVRYLNRRLPKFVAETFGPIDPEPPVLMDAGLKADLHARYVRECEELAIALPR